MALMMPLMTLIRRILRRGGVVGMGSVRSVHIIVISDSFFPCVLVPNLLCYILNPLYINFNI